MSPDPTDEPREAAVEQLEAFGLTEYTARSFVAVLALGTATAKEISEASGVPRTRVYDVMETLQERGLVNVRHAEPRQFWAVSGETASKQFEQRLTRRLDIFREAVDAIDRDTGPAEQRGVWTVNGREAVTARLVEFIESASEEIVFMTVEPLLDEEIVDSLQAARERGVTVKLGEMADAAESPIHEALSEFESIDSLWQWEDTPAGRLLLVDEQQTLVSVLVSEPEVPVSRREETAIWGAGPHNSLVVVLRTMFTWQLD
jgi:sugar-specific transcriptional regulator TrmB